MAKLKCDQHQRRVFAVNGQFIHRGGWGDTCKSPTATIGSETYTAQGVAAFGLVRPPRSVRSGPKELLKEIFEAKAND